ncbi:hypothetical protein AMK27_02495 [Streptomyces sp. CB02009]|nr:hypothetical protein AMK27_02495 [Streptomyces sp. CB02009]
MLHAGEGVLNTGPDLAVLGVVFLLVGQQGPAGAFAVWDDKPGGPGVGVDDDLHVRGEPVVA